MPARHLCLRLATRRSALALEQSKLVAARLSEMGGCAVELLEITTAGDRKSQVNSPVKRDKKDWIRELEIAILENKADFAVHSGKDVPVDIAEGTAIFSVLKRESPFDIFVAHPRFSGQTLNTLRQGAVIGTSSLRRKSELLRLREDFKVIEHRGNVPTRLQKLRQSNEIAGIVLAQAGVNRLGLASEVSEQLSLDIMLPAINQGILVVQVCKGNALVLEKLKSMVCPETQVAWEAERGCVSLLGADCNSCVGIYAETSDLEVAIRCRVLAPDGKQWVEKVCSGKRSDAYVIGEKVAREVLNSGGKELLAACR